MVNRAKVLCLLVNGFEEIEAIAPIDLLRRAEVEVTLASAERELSVKGRCAVTITCDRLLDDVDHASYDVLFLPGGPGTKALRADPRVRRLVASFAEAGKVLAAICAAPTILNDAGLLAGRRFTAHYSVHAELAGALGDEKVVEDGRIVTSRGAGTAVELGLALVSRLSGAAKAEEVARAIMF